MKFLKLKMNSDNYDICAICYCRSKFHTGKTHTDSENDLYIKKGVVFFHEKANDEKFIPLMPSENDIFNELKPLYNIIYNLYDNLTCVKEIVYDISYVPSPMLEYGLISRTKDILINISELYIVESKDEELILTKSEDDDIRSKIYYYTCLFKWIGKSIHETIAEIVRELGDIKSETFCLTNCDTKNFYFMLNNIVINLSYYYEYLYMTYVLEKWCGMLKCE